MNICTYVTSISLQPKLMAVAIYHHTKTLKNLKEHSYALLQLLTEDQADIVRTCGRQSGNSIDKIARIGKKHSLEMHGDFSYLSGCAGFMELEFMEFQEVGGDHVLGIAKVKSAKNFDNTATILTTDYLKEHNIIR